MDKMTIKDIELKGKKVIMRVDFNVPMKDGVITNDKRIKAALPTIKHALNEGAKVILLSHLGRPKGEPKPEFSLKPVAERLAELLGQEVKFVPEVVGDEVKKAVDELKEGEVLVLENTRYMKGETKNDPELAKQWAELADIHVNDAFGTAHRAHASNVGIAQYIPSVAGFLMEKEIKFLSKATANPEKPYVVILGGAKVSDKIGVITNLLEVADKILIGGAMMFTFLKALGKEIGSSKFEEDKVDLAKELLEKANEKGVELVLPVDAVIAQKLEAGVEKKVVKIEDGIEDGWMGLDIGPESIELFKSKLAGAKTVVWNGPMGVFEIDDFATGTKEVANMVAEITDEGAITIIGGGDSAAAIEKFGLERKVSHVSTGGGASLEFLEGKELPGIASIASKKKINKRKYILAGNWKMNKTNLEAAEFISKLTAKIGKEKKFEVVIAPTFLALEKAVDLTASTNINVAAQNMHFEDKGAFTGEVSADMLKSLGVNYVILGHSERRNIFGETDEIINKKIKKALEKDLTPIFCIGEKLEEREKDLTFNVIEKQVKEGLYGIEKEDVKKIVIAYEPVWAIGTGKVATPEQAEEVHAYIRKLLSEMFDEDVAESVTILYGGSVKPENYFGLFTKPNIDGGLVGGASLKESFIDLADIMRTIIA
ncbi:Triosephosphate isomerase [Marinitoga sp. 1135]|uniref:triose-phosphate isomerase n=1 Tax=unclassified Marinitoga TaxID=2640159 RepID=UPI0009503F0A|nr:MULTISPECIES: triose-phosphate isomerase [unclassified Marinitoga]APT75093.1 Triosephosphate isomerase [Marinitoga sp. 1137]NUU94866.1 Triosephosphate isomerase [Marinitoga sp. 1135]NUU96804.1 Triosephosphate isomerase [Marinitoga sp. 1138]